MTRLFSIFALCLPVFCFSQNNALYTAPFGATKGQMAFSYDRLLIAISENSKLAFYSSPNLTKIKKLSGHDATITGISFTRDNRKMVTSAMDSKLLVWDYPSGVLSSTWVAPGPILNSAILDNYQAVVALSKVVYIYDFENSKVLNGIVTEKPITAMAVSSYANIIVVASGEGLVLRNYQNNTSFKIPLVKREQVSAIDISPDGSLVAVGFYDGIVQIFKRSGEIAGTISGHQKWIRCIKFTDDSKYLAVGDDWGNCSIYFSETRSIAEMIKVRKIPIISIAFNHEGSLLTVITNENEISSWDVKKLQIASVFKSKDEKDVLGPQIFISSPQNINENRVTVYSDLVDLKGTIIDDAGVQGLTFNGKSVPLKENNNFIIHVPLAMGENPVTIEAKDVNENISLKKFSIVRKDMIGEEYVPAAARNFLFVIGINDYEKWPKLNNAEKDASDITKILIGQYNFDFENVTFIKNENATRSNIYKSLRTLIEKVGPRDNLVLYFSGHGYFDGLLNEGYWIPADADINDSGDYLSNSDLLKIISNINCQHTFLMADACFAGSLFSESRRGFEDNVERFKSRWCLASGRLEVVSDGEIGKHSPFADVVLEFLQQNAKPKVAISELIQYVKLRVPQISNQTPIGNPLRIVGEEGGELVLYKKVN